MHALRLAVRWTPWIGSAVLAALLLVAHAEQASSQAAAPSGSNVMLDGKQEVPPVNTAATGSGTITVLMDHSVSGTVTTTGVAGTAAHIHLAAKGASGPVIVPLNKTGDNTWAVPPGIRFNDTQYEAYKLGNLYVNVHSAAHPGGEIRGQIMP
ncbi:MAG TPA: CHRD domain-containing protein [Candidatus Bathyarchaeia archaeon]|nr:CHRD domain-containing protein [Candidatus Bathyarchaeia archaeon]